MNKKLKIEICVGSSCFSKGSTEIVETLEKISNDTDVDLELRGCLCRGKCKKGPVVIINEKEYFEVSSISIINILKNEYGIIEKVIK